MSRDPFLRLALLVAGSGYVLGLVLLAGWRGWEVALIVGVVGCWAGLGLTFEERPPAGGTAAVPGAEEPRGLSRDQILRRSGERG